MPTKKMQVTIPKPCHADWDKMAPVEQGRFCGSCQTKVVDFTTMSDAQLVAFFRKPSTGSVCGRLFEDQLGRDMDIPRKRMPWVKYFFQFAIPAFLLSSKAVAQGQVIKSTRDSIGAYEPGNVRGKMVAVYPTRVITGRILNYDEEGIPNIRVSVAGGVHNTWTDSSGYFRLDYEGVANKIMLNVSGDGFEALKKTIRLSKKANAKKYVELTLSKQEDIIVVVGMMAVNTFRKENELF